MVWSHSGASSNECKGRGEDSDIDTKPSEIAINSDIDLYYDFISEEMNLYREKEGDKEEIQYILNILQKYDNWMFKMG